MATATIHKKKANTGIHHSAWTHFLPLGGGRGLADHDHPDDHACSGERPQRGMGKHRGGDGDPGDRPQGEPRGGAEQDLAR